MCPLDLVVHPQNHHPKKAIELHPTFTADQRTEALAFFNANNYLVLSDALSPADLTFLNAFVDRSKKDIPSEWGVDTADIHSHGQILVHHPELDPYTRPETTYPLVEAILGPDARFAQFDFRDVPDGIGEKAAMHFHRDRGAVPPDFWAAQEKDCTFLCAIYYLNDVGVDDTCFCVVPNSQGHADIDEARAQMGDAYAEVPIRGPAGTCVFYNIGIYHTRRPGRNDAGRRTLHQYFSREANPPLTNWALVPRRLAEHADPATRAYYSQWTDLMHDYAASFTPEFYAEHIGQKKT